MGFATAEAEVTEEAIGVQERELRRVRQWGNEGKMGGSCRGRAEEGEKVDETNETGEWKMRLSRSLTRPLLPLTRTNRLLYLATYENIKSRLIFFFFNRSIILKVIGLHFDTGS